MYGPMPYSVEWIFAFQKVFDECMNARKVIECLLSYRNYEEVNKLKLGNFCLKMELKADC